MEDILNNYLFVTHSQQFGDAISMFLIDQKTAHIDLAYALANYNQVELVSYENKIIKFKKEEVIDELMLTNDMSYNIRAIGRYFDFKYMKKTTVNNLNEIRKIKHTT